MPEVQPTRVFTRDDPCTKVHIWNCFIGPKGLGEVAVVFTRSSIGLNTPKYLKNKGFLSTFERDDVEYYKLTKDGKDWLREGLLRHLELHPDQISSVQHYLQLSRKSSERKLPTRRMRVVRKH